MLQRRALRAQDAEYLVAATKAYKDGGRSGDTMKGIASGIDDKALRDVAAHYAAQSPKAPNVKKPLSVAEWADRCDRCHGVNGNSIDPLVPAIAAQRADWLEQVLAAYKSGSRKSTAMSAMTSGLTDADAKEIASALRAPERASRHLHRDPRTMTTPKLHPGYQHFSQLPFSLRFLYSSALCILGMGYLFALVYLFHTYAGKDGDASSVSYQDMVIAYSGSGKGSRLESALSGSMGSMLPKEEAAAIKAWVQGGASASASRRRHGRSSRSAACSATTARTRTCHARRLRQCAEGHGKGHGHATIHARPRLAHPPFRPHLHLLPHGDDLQPRLSPARVVQVRGGGAALWFHCR
jgi:cytochrome c553